MTESRFRRVVLKLSGESFADTSISFGIDAAVVQRIAEEVTEARAELNVEIAIVVGGGNIFRGMVGATRGMDRARADYMGMLATVINALALQDALENAGQPTRVQTAITMAQIAEPYIPLRATRHLEKGRIVLFAAGTGNPYFTTDTTAALRAAEIGAEAILKGTHSGVDGIYTKDPLKHPDAVKLKELAPLRATDSAEIVGGRSELGWVALLLVALLAAWEIGFLLAAVSRSRRPARPSAAAGPGVSPRAGMRLAAALRPIQSRRRGSGATGSAAGSAAPPGRPGRPGKSGRRGTPGTPGTPLASPFDPTAPRDVEPTPTGGRR